MAVNRLIRYSQFSATEIGNEIKDRYGMEELSSCRFFDNGLNDIYQIIVGEKKYYFRISLANIHERIDYEEEVQAILLFSKNGIGVAKPLPMTNGQYIWELEAPEGRRYGVLFEEAKQSSSFDNFKKVRLIGEHLALIHQCSDQNQLMVGRKEIDFETLRDNPLRKVKQYLNHRSEDYRYLVEASKELVTYIEKKVSKASPTYGFCHGDLHSGNVHFDGVRPAIFDFDCMGFGYRAYDICIYAWNESYGNPDYLDSEEWATFLEGYESVRKLDFDEKETLIPFMALRQIWLMGLHADVMDKNAGCCWYNDAYFDEQIGIFKRFYEKKWQIIMEKHLERVSLSYDKAIEFGKKGIDLYSDLPDYITNDPDFPKWKQDCTQGDSGSKEIIEYLLPQSNMKFIDLGCCLNLMFRGYDEWPSIYHGIDISNNTIQLLNKFVEDKKISIGALVCGSIHETTYEDNYFDIGACIGVLEYFEKDFVEKAIIEIHRIMKPSGKVVLDIPNIGDSTCRIMMLIEEHLGRPDRFDMSAQEFEDMLKDYFEIEKADVGAMIQYFLKCRK